MQKHFTIIRVVIAALIMLGTIAFSLYRQTRPGPIDERSHVLGAVTLTEDSPVAPGFSVPADVLPNDTAPTSASLAPARQALAGSKEYRNATYHFALFYPGTLAVKEYDEGNGARAITFENADASRGLDIFIIPYGARQVSAKRFAMDEPSGVMQEPTDIMIDGVRATMFFGHNVVMGDTREVWFIKNGYLFEVTTYRKLDTWLAGIMQSWRFI